MKRVHVKKTQKIEKKNPKEQKEKMNDIFAKNKDKTNERKQERKNERHSFKMKNRTK